MTNEATASTLPVDTFNGDNSKLAHCIRALLSLDAAGALVPHGIGGHARALLSAAALRLAGPAPARSLDFTISSDRPRILTYHQGGCRPANVNECALWDALTSVLTAPPLGGALEAVHGDILPAIDAQVLIHLARADSWEPHTVTGYYVWPDLRGNASLQRVFVQVRDGLGYPNARLLRDVRRLDGSPFVTDRISSKAAAIGTKPSEGWRYTRYAAHDGRCAAHPVIDDSPLETGEADAFEGGH